MVYASRGIVDSQVDPYVLIQKDVEELQTEKKQRAKQNRLFFSFLFWQKYYFLKT